MAILVRISPDSTRDELDTCIASFNEEAQRLTRRGYIGTISERYKDLHDTLDALCVARDYAPLATVGAE